MLGMSRLDHRPGFAAFQDRLPAVQPQAAFELLGLGGVALITILRQQRADLRLEEGDVLGAEGGSRGADCPRDDPARHHHK